MVTLPMHVHPHSLAKRITRIVEVEHFARLYQNAYIQALEGRGTSNGRAPRPKECERSWARFLEILHQILIREGRVPLTVDESVYEQ